MRLGNCLHGLIGDIFDVSAIEASRLQFHDEVKSVSAMLVDVADMVFP